MPPALATADQKPKASHGESDSDHNTPHVSKKSKTSHAGESSSGSSAIVTNATAKNGESENMESDGFEFPKRRKQRKEKRKSRMFPSISVDSDSFKERISVAVSFHYRLLREN